MSDNVLESVRATVQDFLVPELKTHGVKLENLERRLDDTKEVLRAEIQTLEAKMDGRFSGLEARMDGRFNALDARFAAIDSRFATLEALIRSLTQQVTFESGLRERMASIEARLPKQ